PATSVLTSSARSRPADLLKNLLLRRPTVSIPRSAVAGPEPFMRPHSCPVLRSLGRDLGAESDACVHLAGCICPSRGHQNARSSRAPPAAVVIPRGRRLPGLLSSSSTRRLIRTEFKLLVS